MIKNIWCKYWCGHRAVAELPPDGGLHQVVRLQVHCSRGLVQYQHLQTDIIGQTKGSAGRRRIVDIYVIFIPVYKHYISYFNFIFQTRLF